MTIRSRLLLLLLPLLSAFLILISVFFYYNWSREILSGFESRLQSIVVATAQTIPLDEIEWLHKHIKDSSINQNETYQKYQKELSSLKQKFPVNSLYLIQMETTPKEKTLSDVETSSSVLGNKSEDLHSFRQLTLLQISDDEKEPKNSIENFQNDIEAEKVYQNKKPLITPIYVSPKTNERQITAYAPILNENNEVIALLGADVSMKEIDQKLNRAWFMILIGSCLTLFLIMSVVFLIADRISKPVRQLNQAALEIAAGDYNSNINIRGPKEILELAQTLNTMSECLVEHMSRLKESSLVRERMYGEYECALLLQYYMLPKVIEDFQHPHLRIKLVSLPASPLEKGLFLNLLRSPQTNLTITLLEAKDQGFVGLFELNQWARLPKNELSDKAFIECQFVDHYKLLRYDTHSLFPPLVWSIRSQQFVKGERNEIPLLNRDMVFLYSSSLIDQFESQQAIEEWLGRVLRHFAEDGLDTIHTMLSNELTFLSKRLNIKRNFKIIVMQININEK